MENTERLERVRIKGETHNVIKDGSGKLVKEFTLKNQTQELSPALVATLFLADNPDSGTGVDYIALGSGTGQAASDTALATEITTNGGARRGGANATASTVTTTLANDTSQLVVTFTFTGNLAITEMGLFNAASGGVMAAYQDFSVVNVQNTWTWEITWKNAFA